jgi:hypothetical protein
MRWPGLAAVEVALVTIHKGTWQQGFTLDKKPVPTITPYLDSAETLGNPYSLEQNKGKSFIGSYVLGMGFILEPRQAQALIAKDSKNKEVLFPYLNGDDLNNNPDQSPSRWVINFFDWPLRRYTEDEWNGLDKDEKKKLRNLLNDDKFVAIAPPDYPQPVAADYPDCLEIVEREVKPERLEKNDKVARERWWLFVRLRKELQEAKQGKDKVLVHTRVTKTHAPTYQPCDIVFSDAIVVFTENDFTILQSSFHEQWAWLYSSSMKGDRRYGPSDAFETYPFLKSQDGKLEIIGESYYKFRHQLMNRLKLGLTDIYNLFHSAELATLPDDTLRELSKEEEKGLTRTVGKEGLNLYKHLLRRPEATLSYNEAVRQIAELRRLHVEMDTAVLEAYGWAFGSAQAPAIHLRHDFYEVDYLPENDRVRYTLHPEARKEVLKRLLALNHALHAEEEAAKTKPNALGGKRKAAAHSLAAEPEATYHSSAPPKSLLEVTSPLFGSAARPVVIAERSCVTLDVEGKKVRVCLLRGINEGGFSGSYQNIRLESPLAQALLGRNVSDQVEFEGKVYKVVEVE